MVQTVSGIIILVIGAILIGQNLLSASHEAAGRQKGFIGRFGTLMAGVILAFLGVALLLPAREATPVPGANSNPVDNAVEDGGASSEE